VPAGETLRQRHTHWPFAFTLMLMFLGYIGLAISLWPNIVPPSISLWVCLYWAWWQEAYGC